MVKIMTMSEDKAHGNASADDEVAWKVAIALACASNLRWGFYARGYPGHNSEQPSVLIPTAPWDAAAYLDDCARRQVDPGPMPSLSWTGEDGFGWSVRTSDGGTPYVDFTWCEDNIATWVTVFDKVEFYTHEDSRAHVSLSRDIVGRIFSLATAAKRAMEIGKKFFQEVGA